MPQRDEQEAMSDHEKRAREIDPAADVMARIVAAQQRLGTGTGDSVDPISVLRKALAEVESLRRERDEAERRALGLAADIAEARDAWKLAVERPTKDELRDAIARAESAEAALADARRKAIEEAAAVADAERDRCTRTMDSPEWWPDGPKTDRQMADRQAWVSRRGGAKEIAEAIRALLAPREVKP